MDMLNGCGSQVGLNSTRRLWEPSKLHDEIVWSLASTQYSRFDTRSRVSPFGHFTSNDAITCLRVPSMPARSILALLPQSLQYNHLKRDVLNDVLRSGAANFSNVTRLRRSDFFLTLILKMLKECYLFSKQTKMRLHHRGLII